MYNQSSPNLVHLPTTNYQTNINLSPNSKTIIQEINTLNSEHIHEVLDYNTKNKYSSLLYIPENADYNTRNKYSSCLNIPPES